MKNNNCVNWLLFPALILCAPGSYAKQSLWQDMSAALKSTATESSNAFQHRRLQLQESQLTELINQIHSQKSSANLALSLPMPDGSFITAKLVPTELLAESVQEIHPNFRTWRIETDDKSIISGRAELTDLGFHAMLRTLEGDQVFIEPEQHSTSQTDRNYHSHSKQSNANLNKAQRRFSCGTLNTPDTLALQNSPSTLSKETAQRAGESLLTYDLAVAATGEYTQLFGGSKNAALSAITITINRVNEIFEQELAIRFKLISGTSTIYTNASTDPYTNGNATLMSIENQIQLDRVIGSQNYDIGHVLGVVSGGDGLAALNGVCGTRKAQGTTSASMSLQSDAFIVDFVAHELGHQLGATHTFNSNNSGSCSTGNRTTSTAFEPGSGSTIMSYAGICGSNDFQYNADPHMHSKSIEQILNFTHNGSAANCATKTNLNNKLPAVNAGANYTIPARTPFILQGSASDSNSDTLQYSWDQIDAGSASSLGVDTANNALIKSSALSGSGVRHIPDIADLLSKSQISSRGESLPRSDRKLNFRLAVRDGQKNIGGGVAYDDTQLTIKDTGKRFEILSPGSNVSVGTKAVSWEVAGTDQAPINCSHVDIAYTNDQGKTFTDLLIKTPNDGSASVQINETAQRIRVKCNGNIFFALSGTRPHIATYLGDSNQDSSAADSSDNGSDSSNDDEGGSGSLPAGLLIVVSLLTLIRRHYITRKRVYS